MKTIFFKKSFLAAAVVLGLLASLAFSPDDNRESTAPNGYYTNPTTFQCTDIGELDYCQTAYTDRLCTANIIFQGYQQAYADEHCTFLLYRQR